ncbi:MAG TPA: spore germination protein [Syntrophomonadaceae bacterium]|nr:spore germination protein [Syntrophomonadaceae bacterium]HPR92552.1 spore germination protein [Syntrophomonadaceae bacterium]
MDDFLKRDYQANLSRLKTELGEGESFDVVARQIKVMGKKAALLCIDGFVKDEILTEVMEYLLLLKKEIFGASISKTLLAKAIPYIELNTVKEIDKVLHSVLSGAIALIVDGCDEAFIIDARTYPAREPAEPDIERVVRGSRDGFTETLVFNTALLRRRVRDNRLRIKLFTVGQRSKTDVCVCYLQDVCNPDLVKTISERIQNINVDAIPMAEKSVEEFIVGGSNWNPYPRVRYTERPDVAAVHLFEGHVIIIVDTSPSVIIAPVTYFHHVQHAEEYRQEPLIGLYIRWIRFFAVIASLIVTPLWLLFAISPELLPQSLSFIGPKEVGEVPLLLQFVIAEISIDLLRMAAIHTPSPMTTALGVIAALLIGQIAVDIGLLTPEVILYTAVAAVGQYCTPSYELAMANRLIRIFLLIVTGIFKLPGLIIGAVLVFISLIMTKSFGVPYLWPVLPFNYRALKTILVRLPVTMQNMRPEALKPLDKSRQPGTAERSR